MENAGSSRMHDCQTHDVSLKPWMSDSSEVNDQPKNVLNRQILEEENADKHTPIHNCIIKCMKTNISRHQLIDLLTDIQECSDDEKDSLVKLLPSKFYFRDTPFTSSTAHTLAQILPRLHGPVEELDLSRCKLNLDSLKIICEGISKLKYKMEFLDVGGNELGDEEVKIISVILNKVWELRLMACGISATGLKVLCGEIKKLEMLMKFLDLTGNYLGDEEVKIISGILRKVGRLKLRGCGISKDGKQILHEELKRLGLPGRTFVDLCKPSDTVARVRANLLHRLFEIGHANHQFRLRYKGTYLRDAYTLEEYKLLNNAVIQMIPLNDISEWNKDMRFHQSTKQTDVQEVEDIVQVALKSEVQLLDRREFVLKIFKIMMLFQIVFAFLALFTTYWYFFFAYAMVLGISFWFCPSFTRVGGWVGVSSVRRREFMTVMLVLCVLMFGACIALITLSLIELTSNSYPLPRCSNAYSSCFTEAARTTELSDDGVCTAYLNQCYEATVWTSIYFALVIILMTATGAVVAFLLYNFKFTAGDFIEKYLVQTKELEQVMATARTGSVSQKRNAAFELATMAASADDNKFQIVTEGGLEILISLALNPDATTQEYATEAIAECLTVPAIQDQFVAVGGMKTLTALLHTKNARTVREAITAVSYVVSDSDENKPAVLAEHGLDDLAHACKYANTSNRKLLASIFLELAYYSDTREVLCSRNIPTEALVNLLKRSSATPGDLSDLDIETTTLALQSLELLVIESPTIMTNQDELLSYLLFIPTKTLDKKIQLYASKLLLYYTQTPEACEQLCSTPELTDSLLYFAHSNEPELLKVLATISLRITEPFKYRQKLVNDGFQEFLSYLQNACTDRESWNTTDNAISNLLSKEDNSDIRKMPQRPASSMSSTSSITSSRVSILSGGRPVVGNVAGPSTSST